MKKEENNNSGERINNVPNELSEPRNNNNEKDENSYNQIPSSSEIPIENINNDNHLIQNIENDNNNINNINLINNQNDLNIQLNEQEIYNHKITFSFFLFFVINTLGFIHSFFKSYDIKNYSLILWPFIRKKQLYRIFSNHFYHHGIFDYLTNMIGTFYITKYLEKEIGTIFIIIISIHSIILTSIFYLISVFFLKFMLRLPIYNFFEQCGFSSIFFTLYFSYFLLGKNYERKINLLFIVVRGLYSTYLLMFLIQILTPNASLIGNLCGTLSAYIMFRICKFITFPKFEWVKDFESFFTLNSAENKMRKLLGYICVEEDNNIIDNLKQLNSFCEFNIFRPLVEEQNNNNNNQ